MANVIAHHVVFSFYGFWLPNDPRGSNSDFVRSWKLLPFGLATTVSGRASVASKSHDRTVRLAAKREMKCPPVVINGRQALSVANGFADAVRKNGYVVYACSIMPTHIHMVIAAHAYRIEQVVNLLKGSATRRLVGDGLHPLAGCQNHRGAIPSPWGSKVRKVFLFEPIDVRRAIRYVELNPVKSGLKRQRWSFVVPYGC